MSTKRIISSRIGSRSSGAKTTSGCRRSSGNTTPKVCSFATTAWAASSGPEPGSADRGREPPRAGRSDAERLRRLRNILPGDEDDGGGPAADGERAGCFDVDARLRDLL